MLDQMFGFYCAGGGQEPTDGRMRRAKRCTGSLHFKATSVNVCLKSKISSWIKSSCDDANAFLYQSTQSTFTGPGSGPALPQRLSCLNVCFLCLNATEWLKAATAAQWQWLSCQCHQRAIYIPRSSEATIVLSLDHCTPPSTLAADRRTLLLLIVLFFCNQFDTRRKNNPPKRGPACGP